MSILVDTYEPIEVEHLISQSVPVARTTLNTNGYADYLFYGFDGHRIQVERKQIDEVLGGIDDVEEQLGREINNGVEETILLIEGFCEPIAGLKVATQAWHKHKNIMTPGRAYNTSYTGFQAWLNQLDKCGITVVRTFDYMATAMTLVALYQNAQKEEHRTLKRYIKPHITCTSNNPHILNLMSVKGGGIGEERAKALIDRFGTFWYTVNQSVEELANTKVGEEGKRLGEKTAERLLKALGRII